MIVIGLSGPAGAGKSHAARLLAARGFATVKFAGPLKAGLAAGWAALGLSPEEAAERIEGRLKESRDPWFEAAILAPGAPERFARAFTAELAAMSGIGAGECQVLSCSLSSFVTDFWIPAAARGEALSPRRVMQEVGGDWGRRWRGEDFWVSIWAKAATRIGGMVAADDVRYENEADAVRRLGGRVIRLSPAVGHAPAIRPHESERMAWRPDATVENDFTPAFTARLFAACGI